MIPGLPENEITKRKRKHKRKPRAGSRVATSNSVECATPENAEPAPAGDKETDNAPEHLLVITETEEFSCEPAVVEPTSEAPVAVAESAAVATPPKSVWNDPRRAGLQKVGEDRRAFLAAIEGQGVSTSVEKIAWPVEAEEIEELVDEIMEQSDTKSLMMTPGPPLQRGFFVLPEEDPDDPKTPPPIGMYNQLSLNLCFAASVFQLLLSSHYLVSALSLVVRQCYAPAGPREDGEERALDSLLSCLEATRTFNLTARNKFLSTGDQQDAAEFLGHTLEELGEMKEFQFSLREFQKIGRKGKNVARQDANKSGGARVSIFKTLWQGSMVSTLPNKNTYTEPFSILMVYINESTRNLEDLIALTLANNNAQLDLVPPVLFIQLQRTVYDSGVIHKSNAALRVPHELRLRKEWLTSGYTECWPKEELLERYSYELKGVVCHFGNFNDGHYMCYANRGGSRRSGPELGENWYACDDTTITTRFSHNDLYDWTHNGCLFLYEQKHVRVVNPLSNLLLHRELPLLYRVRA